MQRKHQAGSESLDVVAVHELLEVTHKMVKLCSFLSHQSLHLVEGTMFGDNEKQPLVCDIVSHTFRESLHNFQ
jgi:hypothetical protein